MSVIGSNILAGASGAGGGYQISRSVRLRSSASAYFQRTPATAGDRQKFTISFWMKRGVIATLDLFTGNNANGFLGGFRSDNTLYLYDAGAASGGMQIWSARVFRDPSAWYHIVIAVDTTQATDTNRFKVYINGIQENIATWNVGAGASRYPSLNANFDWNNTNSHEIGYAFNYGYFDGYFTEFNNVSGQQLDALSFGETNTVTGVWQPKKYAGTYGTNGFYLNFSDNSTTVGIGTDSSTGSFSENLRGLGTNIGGMTGSGGLSGAFNGSFNASAAASASPSASSGYTSINSVGKDWGVGVTKTITAFQINSPTDDGFRGDQAAVGFKLQGSTDNFSSSIIDLYTGTTPSGSNQSVLVTSGITTTTAYRYHRIVINGNGTNFTRLGQVMFYESGNRGVNQWQPNNISLNAGVTYDSMLDVPTQWADGGNGRGNYCVLNPLNGLAGTLSNANLRHTTTVANWQSRTGTLAVSSGKWYWEGTVGSVGANGMTLGGIAASSRFWNGGGNYPGGNVDTYGYYSANGNKQTNGTSVAYGASYTNNDVIGTALDLDAGTLTFYKNGVSQGVAFTGLVGEFVPAMGVYDNTYFADMNFGQRPFAYTPPSGFKALNTLNLPTPTILKGNQYMDVSLWTGTGSAQSITNSGSMQPDFVWGKIRSGADYHVLANSVIGADKFLKSNTTDAETTNAQTITAFNSNGFSVGTSTDLNRNTFTFVGWQWKEGATQGFDIVTYTGNGANRTIAHNLGVAPSMMIVKRRDSGPSSWTVWHSSFSSIEYIYLNLTNPKSSSSGATVWNSTLPTSSVFSLGTYTDVNANAGTFVAYLFSEVAGFSKFGSYTGNGSTDGPFVFCGFRPAYVAIKRTDTTGNWNTLDKARPSYNLTNLELQLNLSAAEYNGTSVNEVADFCSNGFKLRGTGADANASGGTFIYMAFAENPLKFSLAR